MPSTPRRPTPAQRELVVAYIRAGGYPHVAAEAAGLPRSVFETWLRRGAGPRAPADLRAFRDAVRQAQAQARLGAEIAVFKGRPLDWLRAGPGRETPRSPGWTSNVKPAASAGERGHPLLGAPMQRLIAHLLRLLGPFPEARAALATALDHPADAQTD